MNEIEAMQKGIADLQADRVAFTLMIGALMQATPNYEAMQIHLTRMLEQQLTGGAMGNTLTPEQNERVRHVVEWFQTLKKIG